MANSRSAKKRMRQAERRNQHNRKRRSQLRTAVRRVRESQSAEDGLKAFLAAEKLLDRAARKRLVHPNLAARAKSRLRKHIGKLA